MLRYNFNQQIFSLSHYKYLPEIVKEFGEIDNIRWIQNGKLLEQYNEYWRRQLRIEEIEEFYSNGLATKVFIQMTQSQIDATQLYKILKSNKSVYTEIIKKAVDTYFSNQIFCNNEGNYYVSSESINSINLEPADISKKDVEIFILENAYRKLIKNKKTNSDDDIHF